MRRNWFYGCCPTCRKNGVKFGLAKLKITGITKKHEGKLRTVLLCDTCGSYLLYIGGNDAKKSA